MRIVLNLLVAFVATLLGVFYADERIPTMVLDRLLTGVMTRAAKLTSYARHEPPDVAGDESGKPGEAVMRGMAELLETNYSVLHSEKESWNVTIANPPPILRDFHQKDGDAVKQKFERASILVIGGTKGIGRGIADVLYNDVESFRLTRLVTVGRSHRASNGREGASPFVHVQADLASAKGCRAFVKQLVELMENEERSPTKQKTNKFSHVVFTLGAWPDWGKPLSEDGFDRVLQIDVISRAIIFFELQKAGLLDQHAMIMSVLASAQDTSALEATGLYPSVETLKNMYRKHTDAYEYSLSSVGLPLLTAGVSNDVFLYEAAKHNPELTFVGVFPGIVRTDIAAATLGSFATVLFVLPGVHSLEESGIRHINIMFRAQQLRNAKIGWEMSEQGKSPENVYAKNLFFFDHTVAARRPVRFIEKNPKYGEWLWNFLRTV